jgi:hypothetical protein
MDPITRQRVIISAERLRCLKLRWHPQDPNRNNAMDLASAVIRFADYALKDLRLELYPSAAAANADDFADPGGVGTLSAALHPSLLVFSATRGCKHQLCDNPFTAAPGIFFEADGMSGRCAVLRRC